MYNRKSAMKPNELHCQKFPFVASGYVYPLTIHTLHQSSLNENKTIVPPHLFLVYE